MRMPLFYAVLIIFTFLLASCAAPPTVPTDAEKEELEQLRQQQTDMAQELQDLRSELARLRGEPPSGITDESGNLMPPAPGDEITDLPEQAEGRERYRQAFLDFSSGEYERATVGFQQFIDENPGSPFRLSAYYWLGHSFAGLGKPDKAVLNFEQLLWESPQNSRAPAVLVHMMTLYQRMNQPDKAEQARSILASRYPDSPETRRAMKMSIEPAQEPIEGKQ